MVKNTEKSFAWENKYHTYLTCETLPAEERVSKFHNHRKTSSSQSVADASMRRAVPKSHGSSLQDRGEGHYSFQTGTECHDHPRSALDSIHQNHLDREGLGWNDRQLMTCYTK